MSLLDSIARAFGWQQKRISLPVSSRGRVVNDLSLWEQGTRRSGTLTPLAVDMIIREADTGSPKRLMDLANFCRQSDCHLQASLTVNEESIAGLPWQLTLPDDARAKDKRAMAWVESTLRQCTGLSRLIAQLAGAVYYSYDVNEIVWRREGGKLVPAEFVHLSPRRFGYRPSDGRFVLRDEGMTIDGVDFRAEWPHKFVVSQPRVNGDAPHREGLARLLVWAAMFRKWTVADWLTTAELSWKPWRVGYYKQQRSGTEDRDGLEDVLDKLTTTGWAATSDSTKIDIHWPQGSVTTKATHAEFVNVLAQEMSKAVLGQTETTQSSSSSGYAQAKVHDAVRKDLRESRAKQIAADITRDLVGPMIRLNFGDDVLVPSFAFVTAEAVDLKAFSEAVANLAKTNLRIPAKWVRDTAGIPEPSGDEDEEVLGTTQQPEESDEDPEIPVTVEEPAAEEPDTTDDGA